MSNDLKQYRLLTSPRGGGVRQFSGATLPQIRLSRAMDVAVTAAAAMGMTQAEFVRNALAAWLGVDANEPNLGVQQTSRRRPCHQRRNRR